MKWISVKDRLPKIAKGTATQVIVNNYVKGASEENVQICATFFNGNFYLLEWWQSINNRDSDEREEIMIKNVSHWMEIPVYPFKNS